MQEITPTLANLLRNEGRDSVELSPVPTPGSNQKEEKALRLSSRHPALFGHPPGKREGLPSWDVLPPTPTFRVPAGKAWMNPAPASPGPRWAPSSGRRDRDLRWPSLQPWTFSTLKGTSGWGFLVHSGRLTEQEGVPRSALRSRAPGAPCILAGWQALHGTSLPAPGRDRERVIPVLPLATIRGCAQGKPGRPPSPHTLDSLVVFSRV